MLQAGLRGGTPQKKLKPVYRRPCSFLGSIPSSFTGDALDDEEWLLASRANYRKEEMMRAKLMIDVHGLIDVILYPDTEAEKLILRRLSEVKKVEITKQYRDTQFYVANPELIGVCIGEVPEA